MGEPKVLFRLPLMPYEKKLVAGARDLLDLLKTAGVTSSTQKPSFTSWKWYSTTESWLRCLDMGNPEMVEEYGTREFAYNAHVGLIGSNDKNLCRGQLYRTSNRSFLENLAEKPISCIQVVPGDGDIEDWTTIDEIANANGKPWAQPSKDFLGETSQFDLRELVYIFFLHTINPKNAIEVTTSLIGNTLFQNQYEVFPDSEPTTGLGFQFLGVRRKDAPKRPALETDNDGKLSFEDVGNLLRWYGATRRLPDPRAHLHSIDWKDLAPISRSELIAHGVDFDAFTFPNEDLTDWVLWLPEAPGWGWNHHLHTEDEVLGYCVEHEWTFPGHYHGDKVIFCRRRITETNLVQNYAAFWEEWNDAAITLNSAGDVFVLETIPGLMFRNRMQKSDQVAALKYFRNLVELHAAGQLDSDPVKDILGHEKGYRAMYKNSLRLIPPSELFDIHWDSPLGSGQNGTVYSATWRPPASILASSPAKGIDVPVVLKNINLARGGNVKDHSDFDRKRLLSKFMKELDTTYASLGGHSLGCVDFLGVCKISGIPEKNSSLDLFLVLQRATQGSLYKFLERELLGKDFDASWRLTFEAILGIAGGVEFLHAHNVIHRDLHLDNVLVSDRYFSNDLQNPHEFRYMISDLGEGKNLADATENTAAFASYGNVEARAPELQDGRAMSGTKASEVYSFAFMACKLLELRKSMCSEPTLAELDSLFPPVEAKKLDISQLESQGRGVVPLRLRNALVRCLSCKPDDRPTMRVVERELEEVRFPSTDNPETDGEGVEWCLWNWEDAILSSKGIAGKLRAVHLGGPSSSGSQSEIPRLPLLLDPDSD